MNIRYGTNHDAPAIKSLLESIGYSSRISMLVNQLDTVFDTNANQIFVFEIRKNVIGFVAISFIPQLTTSCELAIITHLSIEESVKNQGVEKIVEQFVVEHARNRKCRQIIVVCTYCAQFFLQQGYEEYTNCFTKILIEAQ